VQGYFDQFDWVGAKLAGRRAEFFIVSTIFTWLIACLMDWGSLPSSYKLKSTLCALVILVVPLLEEVVKMQKILSRIFEIQQNSFSNYKLSLVGTLV